MTAPASVPTRRIVPVVTLLLAAAVAWTVVVAIGRGMGSTSGTMGYGFAAFAAIWTLMMAAMMLPSVAPFATVYTRTFRTGREARTIAFAAGYLLVWAAAAVPAFGLAWLADRVVGHHPNWAIALAAAIFTAFGVYQLTPLKNACLATCRSPLGFALRYSAYRGRTRDLRVGAHHGAYCLGCCWALMLLLLAFGVMNAVAMVVVASAVFVEKVWRHGPRFARVIGVVGLVLAVLVVFAPGLAPGLHHSVMQPMGGM